MELKFCLVPKDEILPQNSGSTYVFSHESDWVDGTSVLPFLSTGFVKGVDHVFYQGKTYMILKSFLDIENDRVVILAEESVSGYDL